MSQAAPAAVLAPSPEPKRRFGLIPARIGAEFCHTLSVPVAIDEPVYSTVQTVKSALGRGVRTTLQKRNPTIEFGRRMADGSEIPTRVLPGGKMYLTVQDITRLEPALHGKVKWVCMHPDCRGKHHASKEALIQSHPENRDLIAEAERAPYHGGQPHCFMGVLEIAGTKGKGDEPDGPATVMLLSDEE